MYYCAKPKPSPSSPQQKSKILFVYHHDDTMDQQDSPLVKQPHSKPVPSTPSCPAHNVYARLINKPSSRNIKNTKPSSRNKPRADPVPTKQPRWNNPRINSVVQLDHPLNNDPPVLIKPCSMELLAKSPSGVSTTPPPLFPLQDMPLKQEQTIPSQPKHKQHSSSMLGHGYEALKKEITRVGSNSSYKEQYRLKKQFRQVVNQ